MYWRYIRNDLVSNKVVTIALTVIIALSALLMATGAMVTERLIGSVDRLFSQAMPPHFLQMHKGDYDRSALDAFAADQPGIESWFVEEMVGFDSAAIGWRRPGTGESGDLSSSLIDNLFVTQSPEFDLLLDHEGTAPRPEAGHVYVPVAYQQEFGLQSGDELSVATDDGALQLTVDGFVRDAQMASSMSSATRFVVSDADFDTLLGRGGGEPEIIVEYRLADEAGIDSLQRAYEADAALPRNGQAVTFPMIRMINVISDGLVAAALVGVSLLLIVIALLNLRFVIRGSLEAEVREIGAMKAIGLPSRDISRLHLARYVAMAAVGCVLGGALAFPVTSALTRGIQANYAPASVGAFTFVVPVLAVLVVFLIVVAICRRVLRRIDRIQVVSALVHGSTLDERQAAKQARKQARSAGRGGLTSARWGSVNLRLALLQLRAEIGQWVLLPMVFALTTVAIGLPVALLGTFESPRFVTYLGAPQADLRADVQGASGLDESRDALLSALDGDERVTDVRVQATTLYETPGEEGWESLRIEVGERAADGIEFVEGAAPAAGEIALSALNADKYAVAPGDPLTVRRAGGEEVLRVSGVYQDVTSGGYTAKTVGVPQDGAANYVVYADTAEGVDPAEVVADYDAMADVSMVPMRDYVAQTLGYVTDALRGAAYIAAGLGLGVALLITALFLELRTRREVGQLGSLYAIGFSSRELRAQVLVRAVLMAGIGVLVGVVFVASIGEAMVGGLLSVAGLGLTSLTFLGNPLIGYVVTPIALLAVATAGAMLVGERIRKADKSAWLRQD